MVENAQRDSWTRLAPKTVEENEPSNPNRFSCSGGIRAGGDMKSTGAAESQRGGIDSVTLGRELRIVNFA